MKIGRLRMSPSASHSLYFGTTEGEEVGWLRNLEGKILISANSNTLQCRQIYTSCPLGKTPTAWYIGQCKPASALAVADFLPDLHFRNMVWLHFQWGLAGLSCSWNSAQAMSQREGVEPLASAEHWHLTDPLVQ
jgi:hypothetical protein